jgi:hypothetical protein
MFGSLEKTSITEKTGQTTVQEVGLMALIAHIVSMTMITGDQIKRRNSSIKICILY